MNHFRVIRLLGLILLLAGVRFNCAAANDLFAAGKAAFESGQFADAAKNFRADLETQPAVGTLLNLGLSEWRRGRAGAAILAWEQASWLEPFDANVRTNLQYARDFIGLEGPDYSWYERTSAWLPSNAWAWIAAGSLWLAVGMFVLPGVLRWRRSGWQQALAALGLVLFLLSLPSNLGVLTRTNLGFVMQRDSALRLTPTSESEVVTKLAAGEPARELRGRGEYILVKTSRGQGWIEKNQFGRISP